MNFLNWRDKKWRKHAMAILTAVVLLMIVSHPELRLLFPLIDAIGLDVLITLLSVQFISLFSDYAKPSLLLLYDEALLPLAGKCHGLLMFFTGTFGHYLTVKIYDFHSRLSPAARNI